MIRPGPPSIPNGTAPGGVVIHVYDTAGVLLTASFLTPGDDVDADAERAGRQVDALRRADIPVVLVAYDGDTGERISPVNWLAWLLT